MDRASFNMKMQAKQLENEARRMQKQAKQERAKAKQELKKGNKAAAELYAKNAIRFEQQASTLLQGCAATNGYATDLRAAVVASQMADNMNKATTGLEHCVKKVDLQKVSAQRSKMDGLKSQMNTANELLIGAGESEMELNAGADDLLAQLEQENQQDAYLQAAEIPTGVSYSTPADPQNAK